MVLLVLKVCMIELVQVIYRIVVVDEGLVNIGLMVNGWVSVFLVVVLGFCKFYLVSMFFDSNYFVLNIFLVERGMVFGLIMQLVEMVMVVVKVRMVVWKLIIVIEEFKEICW